MDVAGSMIENINLDNQPAAARAPFNIVKIDFDP